MVGGRKSNDQFPNKSIKFLIPTEKKSPNEGCGTFITCGLILLILIKLLMWEIDTSGFPLITLMIIAYFARSLNF